MTTLGGGSTGRRSRGIPAMAEINVTPFVDVALVLLIIFMITAHAMESGISIDVPKTQTTTATTKDLPVVSFARNAELYLNDNSVRLVDLAAEIHRRYPGQNEVYVRADSKATWDSLAQVLSVLGNAKLKLNLVTKPDDAIGRGR